MNSFKKTEAAVFSFRPCFLRASLSSVYYNGFNIILLWDIRSHYRKHQCQHTNLFIARLRSRQKYLTNIDLWPQWLTTPFKGTLCGQTLWHISFPRTDIFVHRHYWDHNLSSLLQYVTVMYRFHICLKELEHRKLGLKVLMI